MLFELEPSKDLTGGNWYVGSDFNSKLIEKLQNSIYSFVHQRVKYN
jgi:hypothetical protein